LQLSISHKLLLLLGYLKGLSSHFRVPACAS
jgi:hypothetical protein